MTDPTPSPDVRLDDLLATPADMALVAMHATFHDPIDGGWPGHNTIAENCHACDVAATALNALKAAAAIARTHAHPEEKP